MAVVPTILDNNEIILTLTPVTSQLQPFDENSRLNIDGNLVSLPRINIREMNTMVRIKDGEMLVIGGLIDSTETDSSSKIPGLGDVPGVGKLFGKSGKVILRKELVIFLRPRIIS